jgi:hypothetical protein
LEGEAETGETSSLIGRLTALVGLLTGAVTIVYGAGAAVYWAALNNRDVPSDLAIATSLPREFLVGTGLVFVALPIALTVLLLFALTPILVKDWGQWIFGALLLVGGAGLIIAVQPSFPLQFIGAVLGAVVTAAILTVLLVILVSERDPPQADADRQRALREKELRVEAGRRSLSPDERSELRKFELQLMEREAGRATRRQWLIYLAGVGLVAIMTWGILIGIVRTDLPPAKLCTTDGGAYPGFLIGETANRVYLGAVPPEGEDLAPTWVENLPNQIISAPTADVAKLFIGSDRALCKFPSAAKDKKKRSSPAL